LLKQLGDGHPQYEFVKILAMRCSYFLFGKEHVKEMLKEIAVNTLAGKDKNCCIKHEPACGERILPFGSPLW